jgi:hypothetical protein
MMPDIKFSCQRCGACCLREGFVFLTTEELFSLADYMQQDVDIVRDKWLATWQRRYVLKSHPDGGCVFYDKDIGCAIYPVRPEQCRTYPYWSEDLDWFEKERKMCEGII